MTPQEAYDKAKVDYNLAEKKGDDYLLCLCACMESTIQTQRRCAKSETDTLHPTRFAKTKLKLAQAMMTAAASINDLAKAHKCGDAACDGGPVQQGGGGGK